MFTPACGRTSAASPPVGALSPDAGLQTDARSRRKLRSPLAAACRAHRDRHAVLAHSSCSPRSNPRSKRAKRANAACLVIACSAPQRLHARRARRVRWRDWGLSFLGAVLTFTCVGPAAIRLQRGTAYCSCTRSVPCGALRCAAMRCGALRCGVAWRGMARCGLVRGGSVWCEVGRFGVVLFGLV